MNISPNIEYSWIKEYPKLDADEQARRYPLFFKNIHFDSFRHLRDIDLEFSSPITVISGENKSGKTTALMAIACSHFNFQRRRISNGDLERNTWGDVMRFTDHDIQQEDWTYHVSFRHGNEVLHRQGFRNHISKKWSGVAKKQGQIDSPRPGNNQAGRQVTFIDLERLQPARHLPPSVFLKAKAAAVMPVDDRVAEYLSYILETDYKLNELCSAADNVIYKFNENSTYSSYNSASGEDVLTRLLRDVVDSPRKSLILIEEIEVGLHPRIQRRLMDVLLYESHHSQKQFIVTTHSFAILSAVSSESRLFIDPSHHKCIKKISANAALSKMDAVAYPLINLLVEDEFARWVVQQAISKVSLTSPGFGHLINVIVCNGVENAYSFYHFLKEHYKDLRPKCGFACILDGDQRGKYGALITKTDILSFLPGDVAPEKLIVSSFLASNPNKQLAYHLKRSNPHCLFDKMRELGICADADTARSRCWEAFIATEEGQLALSDLCDFLVNACKRFSPDL